MTDQLNTTDDQPGTEVLVAPVAPVAPVHAGTRHAQFVGEMLAIRTTNGSRSDLIRGDQAAESYRALPHIVPWFDREYELDSALLFAALMARHWRIRHASGVPFGAAVAQQVPHGRALADSGQAQRMSDVQRMRLKTAHTYFNAMLTQLDQGYQSLDWFGLWGIYRHWDHPNIGVRRRVRRQILIDFYGVRPAF